MKILSGIIMLLGALMTIFTFNTSDTVMQQSASITYAVVAYIIGRALENFSPNPHPVVKTEEKKVNNVLKEESKQKSVQLPGEYESVQIKHIKGEATIVTRKQWEKIKNKHGEENYIVLGYQ
jgi:hypothetical protein